MKCARCAHQWKITPEAALTDENAAGETSNAQQAQNQQEAVHTDANHEQFAHEDAVQSTAYHDEGSVEAGVDETHSYEAPGEHEEHGEAGAPDEDWMPGEAGQRSATSLLSQPIAGSDDETGDYQTDPEESVEVEVTETTDIPSWWVPQTSNASAEPATENMAELYEDNEASYDETNDAQYGNQAIAEQQQEDPAISEPGGGEGWSSRFMGPDWKNSSAADPVIDDEDDDPETILRETFQSAFEEAEEQEYEPAEISGENAEPSSQFGSILDADWNRTDDEDLQTADDPRLSHHAATFSEDQLEADLGQAIASSNASEEAQDYDEYYLDEVNEQKNDTPAFLKRGTEEPEPEESYGSYAVDYGKAENQYDGNDIERSVFDAHGDADQAFDAQDRLDEFDSEPDQLHDVAGLQNYDESYEGQFEEAAERDIAESDLSDDLLGLGNRSALGEEGVVYPPESQSRNGLALASAWAVFLFGMGGIVMGLLSLRQEVATALPGTIELYRVLGYDVSANKVDFAAVDYRWSDVDGRPMIEVKGQVINITDETVNVPPVLVNVQSSSSKPVTATASVPTNELGPRDSAPFTLELVSPPEDVTQIELEFAPMQ